MILTAHQPAYLPWIGYFAKMAAADTFVLHDVSRYERGGMLNRNKIRTATGSQLLTVPVSHEDLRAERLLTEIRPVADGWQRRHWQAIQHAYRRAPYFGEHADFLADYYRQDYQNLSALCLPFIDYAARQLGLPGTVARTSELTLPPFDRNTIVPMLCRRFAAEEFLVGAQAPNYLDAAMMARAGIRVPIFRYRHPEYRQNYPGFISHLSVLDLLMNCGPDSGKVMRSTL